MRAVSEIPVKSYRRVSVREEVRIGKRALATAGLSSRKVRLVVLPSRIIAGKDVPGRVTVEPMRGECAKGEVWIGAVAMKRAGLVGRELRMRVQAGTENAPGWIIVETADSVIVPVLSDISTLGTT